MKPIAIQAHEAHQRIKLAHNEGLIWRTPEGRLLAASGQIMRVDAATGVPNRGIKDLVSQLLNAADLSPDAHPLVLFSLGFDGLRTQPIDEAREPASCPPMSAWIPAFVVSQAGPDCGYFLRQYERLETPLPRESSQPDARADELTWFEEETQSEYIRRVDAALNAIDAGELEKVVLARAVRAVAPAHRQISSEATFDALVANHGDAHVFSLTRQGDAFLGASPERLATLQGGQLSSHALAGTFSEDGGDSYDKLLWEHQCVVAAISRDLEPLMAGDLAVAQPPMRRAAGGMSHLETQLSGPVRAGRNILDLIDALHPTPALAGSPRRASLDHLRRSEPLQRGLYGGVIGFKAPGGDGEAFVAIRCGSISDKGGLVRAYAGAGIVGGSEANEEWVETERKLRSFRSCLRLVPRA